MHVSETLSSSVSQLWSQANNKYLCGCVRVCLHCRGEHCGGCRRSNSTEKPHAFQVILTARSPLELSAENELDMAEWMQLICQAVSKGVS